jgi:uncharacterized glyoxalase superfamily protein PhnB
MLCVSEGSSPTHDRHVHVEKPAAEWAQELMTYSWGRRAFYVRDPDGNVFNFHTVMQESRG